MYVLLFVFLVAIFVAFVPGVLITLPPRGSRNMVLLTHGILFALVWALLHSTLSAFASRFNYKIGNGVLEAMSGRYPVVVTKKGYIKVKKMPKGPKMPSVPKMPDIPKIPEPKL